MGEVRLIGICSNPESERMWWPAESTDDPCIMDCPCEPTFWTPATAGRSARVVVELANFAYTEGQLGDDARELAEALAEEAGLAVLWKGAGDG